GTFDQAQLRRGLQVYTQVCSVCHSLKFVAYRHLDALGFSGDEIKAIAAQKQVEDGPDDNGDMFMRPARPSDIFVPPYANDNQARAFNGGALPPDLSLITKARHGGPDYVRALLVGFEDPVPDDVELAAGMNYNKYFTGNQIAMFAPLFEGAVAFEDGTNATVEQMAEDVVAFLAWTAEPELVDRKRIGLKTLIFLIILAGLLYATKRKVWSDLH
ncbi:MAG: cytochrome c1, partial [Alphaproteobacteria bacterium]|nr:cytochrome c1 [Alphaproteobacteria bacterium]